MFALHKKNLLRTFPSWHKLLLIKTTRVIRGCVRFSLYTYIYNNFWNDWEVIQPQ